MTIAFLYHSVCGIRISLMALSIFVCTLLLSCSNEASFRGRTINLYADAGRTNNYEHLAEVELKKFSTDLVQGRDSSTAILPLLCLGTGETIVATGDRKLICLSYDKVQWEQSLRGIMVAGMCADVQGNIYGISSDNMFTSFSPSGTLRFSVALNLTSPPGVFCDLLCLEDGVVCAAQNGTVIKWNFEGKEIWRYQAFSQPLRIISADARGNIALPLASGVLNGSDSLLIIGNDGKIRWAMSFDKMRITTNIAWRNNKLYIGGQRELERSSVPVLHCINDAGQYIWSKELGDTPRSLSLSDTAVYVVGMSSALGDPRSVVSAYSCATGAQQWELYYQAAIVSPLLLGVSSLTFVATQNKAVGVYRMGKDGVYRTLVSMSDAPLFNLQPSVAPDGSLLFGCREKLGIIGVAPNPFGTYLPF